MILWFIRHARAVDREETTLTDFQRPLTPKGRKQFSILCRKLAKRLEPPQLLLTSPLIRAVQTAEIVRREFDISESACRVDERLSPDFDLQKLKAILQDMASQQPDLKSLAIVGHEPSFGVTLSETIGGGSISLAKGAIAEVEFSPLPNPEESRLKWLIVPKLIEK